MQEYYKGKGVKKRMIWIKLDGDGLMIDEIWKNVL